MSMKSSTWLRDQHARDVHSQFGEDGIIEYVLGQLPETDRWCVEFGAWDGKFLSNTFRLIEQCDYRAVLIEGNEDRVANLRRLKSEFPRIEPLHRYVDTGDNRLDLLLADYPIPKDFDFLSIDIDGNDFHVWKAVVEHRPKIVCIEFNPSVPNAVSFVQEPAPGVMQGCSLRALLGLGLKKGYQPVAVTDVNVIFVDGEYFDRFDIPDTSPEALRPDEQDYVTYFYHGYDGTVLMEGRQRLVWHRVGYRSRDIQLLPKFLRRFPNTMSRPRRLLLRTYYFLRRLGIF